MADGLYGILYTKCKEHKNGVRKGKKPQFMRSLENSKKGENCVDAIHNDAVYQSTRYFGPFECFDAT
jgi:hypothetical protein